MSSEHGTRSSYVRGCRCEPCRVAERQYKNAYAAEQRRLVQLGRAVEQMVGRRK